MDSTPRERIDREQDEPWAVGAAGARAGLSRRRFLRLALAGASTAAIGGLLAACGRQGTTPTSQTVQTTVVAPGTAITRITGTTGAVTRTTEVTRITGTTGTVTRTTATTRTTGTTGTTR